MINLEKIELKSFYLNVTDACNLACKYCFVEQHPNYMTLDMAKKGIEYFKKNKIQNEKGRIVFFGGEPTLCWDTIIVPLVEWINETYPNDFAFNMTTNATLLNTDRIIWLKENNFSLLLSCDGDETTQNINRPCRNKELNCFEMVSNNFNDLLEYFPNITFRSTIDQSTCENTYNNFMYALNRGFKSHFSIPNCREIWDIENIFKLKQSMDNIFLYYKTNYKSISMKYAPLEKEIKKLVANKKEKSERTHKRCGLGTTGISMNYKGDLFACQEQPSYGEDALFHIGNIEVGIDIEKRNKLINQYLEQTNMISENPSLCLTCPINCTNQCCPSTLYDLYGCFNKIPEILCYWKQWMYNAALDIYQTYKDEEWFIEKYKNKKSQSTSKKASNQINTCSGLCESCNSCTTNKKKKFNLFDWWEQKKIELNNKQN